MPAGALDNRTSVTARDGDWDKQAACRPFPKEMFCGHPWERDLEKKIREYAAKAICEKCPVRAPCLEEALVNREYGIWGGTNELDRVRIRKRRRMT